MKLTEKDIDELQALFESLYNDPRLKAQENIPQHRGSNTYWHTLKVTRRAFLIAKSSHLKVNYHDLITGAMLHDYFQYNWREDRSKLHRHGHLHPKIALVNAKRDFNINKKVENIIVSHMWPINIFHVHTSLEGHIVSLADKYVSICEALTSKKYKEKHKEKYLKRMFTLK